MFDADSAGIGLVSAGIGIRIGSALNEVLDECSTGVRLVFD